MPAHSAYDLDRHMTPQLPPTNPPSPQVPENVQRAVECYVHNANNANNHMSGSAPAFDICVSDDIRPTVQIPNPFEQHAERRSQNMTECVAVPSSEHVAEIVGRQGCKIKALRAKTNTYIKTPVRGDEPVFVVTGRKEDVYNAKREILSAAEHFSQIRACRKNNLNGSMAPGPPVNMPGQITKQVRVPYRVVGLVVGPKGATIKRIQQNTRTYIVTPSRDKDPVFEVTGLPDSVDNAKKEIESHIALRTGGVNEGDDNMSSMNVASNLVNAVRGSYDNTQTQAEKNLLKQLYTPSNSYSTESYQSLLNNLGNLGLGPVDLPNMPVGAPSARTISNMTNGNSYNLQSNAGQLFGSNKPFGQEFGLLQNRCKSPGTSGHDVVGLVDEGLGSSNGSSPSFNTNKASSIWGDTTSASTSQRVNTAMQAALLLEQGRRGSTGSGPTPPSTRLSPGLNGVVDNDYRYSGSASAFPFSFGNGFPSTTRALSPDDMKFITPDFSSRRAPGCDRNSPTSPLEEMLCRACKTNGAISARVPCGHDNSFCLACVEQITMSKLTCPFCLESLTRQVSEIKN